MKKLKINALAIGILTASMLSCAGELADERPPVYEPDWYYNCYPVYDSWGYYLYDDCYWEYYGAGVGKTKPVVSVPEN